MVMLYQATDELSSWGAAKRSRRTCFSTALRNSRSFAAGP